MQKTAETYIFDSVDVVAMYLYSLNEEISPVKLHKSLYFLSAYFGAVQSEKESEAVYLFPDRIEAWKYGPVIRRVFDKRNDKNYFSNEKVAEAIKRMNGITEIKQFIDGLINDIHSVSDFSLVFEAKKIMHGKWHMKKKIRS